MSCPPKYIQKAVERIARGEPAEKVNVDHLVDFPATTRGLISQAVDCARAIATLCPEMLQNYGRGTEANGNLRAPGIDVEAGYLAQGLAAAIDTEKAGGGRNVIKLQRLEKARETVENVRRIIAQLNMDARQYA